MHKYLLLGTTLLALSACDFSPEMKLEDLFSGAAFREDAAKPDPAFNGATITPEELGKWKRVDENAKIEETTWWKMFAMHELDALMDQAMAQNPTLEAAAQRVAAARGLAEVSGAALLPSAGVAAGPIRQQAPAASINANLPPGTNVTTKPYTLYTAQGNISYALDLFGKNRNTAKAAALTADAEANAYRAARLLLQAEIAQAYVEHTSLVAEKNVLLRTVESRGKTRGHIRNKHQVGAADDLMLANAEHEAATAEAELSVVSQQLARSEHALAVLVGVTPAQLVLKEQVLKAAPPVIPGGLRASLLERRPDVQAAASMMAAANVRIGAARAGYLPDISLSLVGGFSSVELSDLFRKSNKFWSLGPMAGAQIITQPLFEGGRIEGTLAARKAEYAEANANYKATVLQAFREVEDNLSGLRNLRDQAKAREVSLNAARRAATVATSRLEVGYSSQIEFLDAERNRLAAERATVQVLGQRYVATIQLIKALGGSW